MSEGEPWGAQKKVVEALLSEKQIKVANFLKKRQIWNFAQIFAASYLVRTYLYRDEGKNVTWIDNLALDLLTMNKALDGKSVKLASKVAIGGTVRSIFNISRWKKLIEGEEKVE